METAKIDSPRGSFALTKSHNPIHDIYLRKVEGKENKVDLTSRSRTSPIRRAAASSEVACTVTLAAPAGVASDCPHGVAVPDWAARSRPSVSATATDGCPFLS